MEPDKLTLNERIAKVKGWEVDYSMSGSADQFCAATPDGMLKDWRTDIADAWELVEEMFSNGHHYIDVASVGDRSNPWECEVSGANGNYGVARNAPTAPEAICLAYLAVMEKEDD